MSVQMDKISKLTRFSMFLNFASYMKISILENKKSLLEELRAKQFYKPKKCLLYQLTLLHLLHLRYTPLQACHLLLNKYHFWIKSKKGMEEKVQRPKDTFICNTLHSIRVRIIVRSNEEWHPYKEIVVSMTFGLKYPFPYRIQVWKTT